MVRGEQTQDDRLDVLEDAAMLKDIGLRYAIVGHSERRQYQGESDQTVALKAKAALAAGITPIVCVGETLAEREAGKTEEVCARQIDAVLKTQGAAAFEGVLNELENGMSAVDAAELVRNQVLSQYKNLK